MPILATLILTALFDEQAQTKPYRDNGLGLIFDHPTAWTVKNEKYSTDFLFPLADGSTATVQVFRTSFRQPKSDWQQIQTDINTQLKRRVVRQWEEQILGVPLLMTQIEYSDGARDLNVLVGLLYTATAEKLNFRLVSSSGAAQEAESAWRAVMLSLRTTNGELPVPEDPTRPLPNPITSGSGKPVTTLKPNEGPERPLRTKNIATIKRLSVDLAVYLPEGWTVESKEERLFLRQSGLKGEVELQVYSGGRSVIEPTLKAAGRETLSQFNVVTTREDQPLTVNRAACSIAGTLRIGTDKQGAPLVVWHAVGNNETFVWRFDYFARSEKDLGQDRKAIERLLDQTAIEIAR